MPDDAHSPDRATRSGGAPPGDRAEDYVYDWNEVNRRGRLLPLQFGLFDETLRDGLQNPSVVDPSIEDKVEILHLMNDLGIEHADIGLPGSSSRAFEDCLRLAREVVSCKMKIRLACAGRTVTSDITPMVEVSQKAGAPIDVYAFIGSSPIRQYVEQWDLKLLAQRSADAIDVAVKHGMSVCFVTEDTTRSRPEALATLFRAAVDHGAARLCLSDTVGHATPDGVKNLVTFTKNLLAGIGAEHVGIDWHGHNDRGFALENAIWALEFGATRVHATALGIGERVGNAQMELLLMNLKLLGQIDHDLTKLLLYCETVAKAVGWKIPINYPLVGRDAFRTATGVHAAAIIKAMGKQEDRWLADSIYSGVPAGMFGRSQEICIGFMSGASNVNYWLRQRGIPTSEKLVADILRAAKAQNHIMTDDEVLAVVKKHDDALSAAE